ncbi:MAG: DUF3159 domain-containing protein [Micrococcales bacterium]|nr:DUF3159 domain-containing protein [Micrococcales bacterium]
MTEEHDLAESGSDSATSSTGWKSVLGDQFDWMAAMGGRRGLVESVAPGLVFVVVYVIHPALWPAVISSLSVALVAAVVRLIQRATVMGAVSGLGGIVIGAIWAGLTGRAENFMAWGLWVNGAWLAGTLLTIAIRFPLASVVVAFFTDHLKSMRQNKLLMRRGYWATWLLAGLFAARLAAQLPLYTKAEVAWLGTVKLAMGLPLFALVLWVAWWWLRPVVRQFRDDAGSPEGSVEALEDYLEPEEPEESGKSEEPDTGVSQKD